MLPVWTKCLFCGWAPVARLEFILGPMANQTLHLTDEVTTIGSVAGNTVVLADPAVSRKHAGHPQGRRRTTSSPTSARPTASTSTATRCRRRPSSPATSSASATPRRSSSASSDRRPTVDSRRDGQRSDAGGPGRAGWSRGTDRDIHLNGTPDFPGQPGPRGDGRAVTDRDRLRRPRPRVRDPHRRRHGVAPARADPHGERPLRRRGSRQRERHAPQQHAHPEAGARSRRRRPVRLA